VQATPLKKFEKERKSSTLLYFGFI
jgi:hypothetical protein